MTVIGYIRVSTDKQDLSVSAQAYKIRSMAATRDIELSDADLITDDGYSAKSLDRPGVRDLLARVKARQVGMVIVAKLDRLTRSVRDLAELVETFNRYGVALVSVAETLDTGSAAGRMVMNIMATVAQWEREVIGERTSEALQEKRRRHQRAGTIPYGMDAVTGGIELCANMGEQEVIRTIRDLRALGQSMRTIADTLNESGTRTRRGTPWRHQYVANILKSGQS